jgi:hypothetical protein
MLDNNQRRKELLENKKLELLFRISLTANVLFIIGLLMFYVIGGL